MSITFSPPPHPQQNGIVLIEALVSILIFSVGVLAIIGLLTASVISSRDSTNRAAAGSLASQIIGQMWADDHSLLSTNYATSGVVCTTVGTNCNNWLNNVKTVLPGVAANPPAILVVPQVVSGVQISNLVTVTISWKPPDAPATAPAHKYTTVTQINTN